MREVTGSSPVSSTTEKALKLNGFRAFSFALVLGKIRRCDKSTTLLAKKKRFSGGLNGAESPRKNLSYSVFLPRTRRSISLIRRDVDPSLRQAPLEYTALYDRADVSPQSMDVFLTGEYPPVLGGLKLD